MMTISFEKGECIWMSIAILTSAAAIYFWKKYKDEKRGSRY